MKILLSKTNNVQATFGTNRTNGSQLCTNSAKLTSTIIGITVSLIFCLSVSNTANTQSPVFDFSNNMLDQYYNHLSPKDEWNFAVINNTAYNGWNYEGALNGYHTYRLVFGYALREPSGGFMHHNTRLDLTKPFKFSSKVGFFGVENQGLTFCLHNNDPYDTLIGMSGEYLGYG